MAKVTPVNYMESTSDSVSEHAREVLKRLGGKTLEERDSDAMFSKSDTVAYLIENYVASDSNAIFKLLLFFTSIIMIFGGLMWSVVVNLGHVNPETQLPDPQPAFKDANERLFNAFQIIATGGFDSSIGMDMKDPAFKMLERLCFTFLLMAGLVVFAILVGIITAWFEALMSSIEEGKTKVAETHHTLILGWNQSTIRVVCQIAFLRRAWRVQNERWDRKYFPWRRVPPSSPVAKYPIVVMCNKEGMDKADMDEALGTALAERGISPKRTKIGWDVVCRVGDPTSVHDLVRVNAKNAKAIMLMMTEEDEFEFAESDGKIVNGATIRTMLALRSCLCASKEEMERFDTSDIRIVVQLQQASRFVEAASFRSTRNKKIIETMDLTVFVNTLMFLCASKPNLSQVVTSVMNFEDAAMRLRRMDQILAGPNNVKGYLIGKTFEEAYKENCWAKSILIGVTNVSVLYETEGILRGPDNEIIGICAQPDYIIRADDLAMFISPVSMPKVSPNAADRDLNQTKRSLSDLDLKPFGDDELVQNLKRQQKLLVCGWRKAWTKDPKRLRARVFDVAKCALKDSYIVFLNQASSEKFKESLKIGDVEWTTPLPAGTPFPANCSTGYQLKDYPYVKIYHCSGDAGNIDVVEPVMREPSVFTCAIVLGTQATQDLSPQSMDTRVLSILLLLKHLTTTWENKMEIISENQLDQTADIAVTPGGADKDPDFVNTQAISARGLTMAMAYPRMQPAVNELFQDTNADDGTPEFDLVSAEFLGLVDKELRFGVVMQVVYERFKKYAVAFGVMEADGTMKNAPGIGYTYRYKKGDRIVIMHRVFHAIV